MLIPRKSHFRIESRNSWVLIETLDFARVRTCYRHDHRWGREGGEGAIAGWTPMLFLADTGTPSIDQHNGRWRARNGWGRELQGSATGVAQWLIGPRTTGRGIAPPPHRMPLDNRSTSRADGRAKRRAAAGSLAQWCTCQNADMERDRGTRSPPTRPIRQVQETPGPPSDTAGLSARHLSGLSCSL